jgi:hypothetical protein
MVVAMLIDSWCADQRNVGPIQARRALRADAFAAILVVIAGSGRL